MILKYEETILSSCNLDLVSRWVIVMIDVVFSSQKRELKGWFMAPYSIGMSSKFLQWFHMINVFNILTSVKSFKFLKHYHIEFLVVMLTKFIIKKNFGIVDTIFPTIIIWLKNHVHLLQSSKHLKIMKMFIVSLVYNKQWMWLFILLK